MGILWVPPEPGKMPSMTSGSPMLVFMPSTAILYWQARAVSSPPPRHGPMMAATIGLLLFSISKKKSCPPLESASASSAVLHLKGPRRIFQTTGQVMTATFQFYGLMDYYIFCRNLAKKAEHLLGRLQSSSLMALFTMI